GHRRGLRGAVRDDGALVHARHLRDREELAGVGEARIDLVGVHPDLRVAPENRRDLFELFSGQQPAGRVVGIVENQQPGFRRDELFQIRQIKGEPASLAQVDRHGLRAARDDLRLVDREAGVRVDHFVAGAVIGGRQHRVSDERLRARADHDVFRSDGQAAARRGEIARRRLAQLVDPRRRRVAVLARLDRADRRLLHVVRRREIGLAELQEEFDLHPLAVEDARHGHQRPKLEEYGHSLFVVLNTIEVMGDELRAGELDIFAGRNYVLSVRRGTEHGFQDVRARCEREPELLRNGSGYVLYALMAAVGDRYFPVLEAAEGELDDIE